MDIMLFKSPFANCFISEIITLIVKKAGYDADIQFNGISMEHSEDGKIKLTAKVNATLSEKDIRKLMNNFRKENYHE